MKKKYYYAKEITCPVCEGLGIYLPTHDLYLHDCGFEEQECDYCDGKGYVLDIVDKATGYQIIELEEEDTSIKINHLSYETVNDVIAETWGIIEYEGNMSVASKPHYEFITENWVYEYVIVNVERVKETDKKLIPTVIKFEGEMCYAISTNTRRK